METNNAAEIDLKMKRKGQFSKGRQYYSCKECGFSEPKSKIKWHIESKQIGISYSCDKCDSKQSSESMLKIHKKMKHKEGVGYKCNFCDYQTTYTGSLNVIHEGAEHFCTQCTYKTSRISTLIEHTKSFHEGVRYSCKSCKFKARKK